MCSLSKLCVGSPIEKAAIAILEWALWRTPFGYVRGPLAVQTPDPLARQSLDVLDVRSHGWKPSARPAPALVLYILHRVRNALYVAQDVRPESVLAEYV
jgi:hypothetical protein